MYILIVTAVVDLLLPSVQIPLVAWILIIFMWVCGGAVKEARKRRPAPAPVREETFSPQTWIMSKKFPGVYATPDSAWSITSNLATPPIFVLWGDDGDQNVILKASNIGEAMDKADKIISALEA